VWPVRFTEAARAELIEAQDWYEAEVPGLGGRFRGEIDSVVGRMAEVIQYRDPAGFQTFVTNNETNNIQVRPSFSTKTFSPLKWLC
jgi:hypothetical protein